MKKDLGYVKGPKGDTGPQGAVGPQGAKGEKGDPARVCGKLAGADGNIQLVATDVGGLSAEQINAALARKADKTGTIYYIGGTVATPDTTGFPTLAAYLRDMYHKGYRGVCGHISSFEELDVKQWGYGVLATPGEHGYVWNVEIFRSLTSTRQYRQLNASTGNWIMDGWEGYATKTDLLNKANKSTSLPGGVDLNTVLAPDIYYCGYTATFTNFPTVTNAFSLRVYQTRDNGVGLVQVFNPFHVNITYFRTYNIDMSPQWSDWALITTTTKPEEHVLPLAAGLSSALEASKYAKDQFGRVLIHIAVDKANGAFAAGEHKVASLPVGYCPKYPIYSLGWSSNPSYSPCGLAVYPDGSIHAFMFSNTCINLFGTISFTVS